jgi:hypothetical protein
MSELRDLTAALRSFDKRLNSVEQCLVILVRNSQQQAEWRHDQKNRAIVEEGLRLESERAMLQVQEACGAISHKLAEVVERLDNQVSTRLSDVKGLSSRVGLIENQLQLEVTKT